MCCFWTLSVTQVLVWNTCTGFSAKLLVLKCESLFHITEMLSQLFEMNKLILVEQKLNFVFMQWIFQPSNFLGIVFSGVFSSSFIFSPFVLPHVIEENTEFSVFFLGLSCSCSCFLVYWKASWGAKNWHKAHLKMKQFIRNQKVLETFKNSL